MNNIKSKINKVECCGCTACMAICAHNAIKMQRDEEGFYYPLVNENACSNCGLCVNVCPNSNTKVFDLDECYATKRKNREKLLSSTSGGFAAALSEHILKQGGIVYGVAYKEFPHVATIRVDNIGDAEKFKGSKYVQSELKNTFKEALIDLKEGKMVLFTATSCHINGLLNYLSAKRIDTSNLITLDFVCHGVPSPKLFEEYIDYISKHKHKVLDYKFRTKSHKDGWGAGSAGYCPTIIWENRHPSVNTLLARAYQILFFSNNALRPHCYQCPYAGAGRPADFTVADYWGVKDFHPIFFSADGVSLVFVSTDKAKKIFNSIEGIEYISTTFEKAVTKQANLQKPSKVNPNRERFWKDYIRGGIKLVLFKYCGLDYQSVLKWYIKLVLQKFKILKK